MTNTELPAAAKDLIASQGWSDETVADFMMSFLESKVEDAEDKIADYFEALGDERTKKMEAEDPAGYAETKAEYGENGLISFEAAKTLGMIAEMDQAAMAGHLLAIVRQELGDIDDELTSYLAAISRDETNDTAQPGR